MNLDRRWIKCIKVLKFYIVFELVREVCAGFVGFIFVILLVLVLFDLEVGGS